MMSSITICHCTWVVSWQAWMGLLTEEKLGSKFKRETLSKIMIVFHDSNENQACLQQKHSTTAP